VLLLEKRTAESLLQRCRLSQSLDERSMVRCLIFQQQHAAAICIFDPPERRARNRSHGLSERVADRSLISTAAATHEIGAPETRARHISLTSRAHVRVSSRQIIRTTPVPSSHGVQILIDDVRAISNSSSQEVFKGQPTPCS